MYVVEETSAPPTATPTLGQGPIVANNGPDDVGQGRLLPTTSVDQYAVSQRSLGLV